MTRVSLTECYDDRSVISKLKRIEDKVDGSVQSAEASAQAARQSADAAQHTADTFSGAVGSVVGEAQRAIAQSRTDVTEAKTEVENVVEDVASAVRTANQASASAQASATTVATYGSRLSTVEDRAQGNSADIQHLEIETRDLYDRDADNVKLHFDHEQTMTGGLKVGGHDLTKAVTTNEVQTITGLKTHRSGEGYKLKLADSRVTKGERRTVYTDALVVKDKDDQTLALFSHRTQDSGDVATYMNAQTLVDGANVSAEATLVIKADGSSYATAPTPTDSAPSNALVTKANVMSTDGKLNNLVHTIGNERIDGYKIHNTGMVGRVGWSGRVTAVSKIAICDVEYNASQNNISMHLFVDCYNRYTMYRGEVIFDITPTGEVINMRKDGWAFRSNQTTRVYAYKLPNETKIRVAIGNHVSANNHICFNLIGGYADAGYIITFNYDSFGANVTTVITDSTSNVALGE